MAQGLASTTAPRNSSGLLAALNLPPRSKFCPRPNSSASPVPLAVRARASGSARGVIVSQAHVLIPVFCLLLVLFSLFSCSNILDDCKEHLY